MHGRYSAIIMSELYGIVDAHEDLLATLLLACEAVMRSRHKAHRSTASTVVSSGVFFPHHSATNRRVVSTLSLFLAQTFIASMHARDKIQIYLPCLCTIELLKHFYTHHSALSTPTLPNLGKADACSDCATDDAAGEDATIGSDGPDNSGGVEVWSIFKNRPFSMNFLALLHDTGAFRITQVVRRRALVRLC